MPPPTPHSTKLQTTPDRSSNHPYFQTTLLQNPAPDELADLLARQVVVPLPRQLLLLHPLQQVARDPRELPEGRLAAPHAPVDHLAQVERLVGQLRPAALEDDLKDGAQEPAGGLGHEDHVGGEAQALQLELADVGLQQHVDLREEVGSRIE
jgi:hypothetical protein